MVGGGGSRRGGGILAVASTLGTAKICYIGALGPHSHGGAGREQGAARIRGWSTCRLVPADFAGSWGQSLKRKAPHSLKGSRKRPTFLRGRLGA
jgi:hypothetical protein